MKEVLPDVLEKRRAQQREYKQRPEVKERNRAYMKEYTKRPEVKERRKAYEKKKRIDKAKIALQKRIDKAVAFLKEHGYSVIKEEPHDQQSRAAASTDSGHVS